MEGGGGAFAPLADSCVWALPFLKCKDGTTLANNRGVLALDVHCALLFD